MAVEGIEVSALSTSQKKAVQDALGITDISTFLMDRGYNDASSKDAATYFSSHDFNDFNKSGFFKINGSFADYTHAPATSGGYGCLIIARGYNAIIQIYIDRNVPHGMYIRDFDTTKTTEYAWTKIADTSALKGETLNVTGNSTLNGNLEVKGNITQTGSSYETHAEQVYTKKDNFIMREGATTGLGDDERAGVVVKKYNGTTDGHLCIDNTGTARVGDVGSEEPLCTRKEASEMTDGKFVKWNASTLSLETSDDSIATINDSATSVASAWSSSKTNTQIKGFGRLHGTCSTAADTQAKTVTGVAYIGSSDVIEGLEINITFSNGSTYGADGSWGQCPGLTGETGNATANTIARANAPTLSVNGSTAYPITVEGQYAGENFINAGATHTFVLTQNADGMVWEDLTAKNIYCSKTRNYSKNRDGLIEQSAIIPSNIGNTPYTWNFQIPFSQIPDAIKMAGNNSSGSSSNYHVMFYEVSTTYAKTQSYTLNYQRGYARGF